MQSNALPLAKCAVQKSEHHRLSFYRCVSIMRIPGNLACAIMYIRISVVVSAERPISTAAATEMPLQQATAFGCSGLQWAAWYNRLKSWLKIVRRVICQKSARERRTCLSTTTAKAMCSSGYLQSICYLQLISYQYVELSQGLDLHVRVILYRSKC